MSAGTPGAFALLRVPRGQGRPSEAACRDALVEDRARLAEPAPAAPSDLVIAGPYGISVDGADLDEYVVWER